ncbi:endocuticle structural glycoprotein SgAbd-4-like [Sitodiplosis mosellana]|uniref:endocuticle structural glycoprotein SgAbd-4-like n=1 Tax=Sitodiplosis mosellana TaxID=263140 RepID=UPI00244374EF|nr:endocuticle structural glycoprotein SgAbd-4-like [Sitodiplosis mosellana]
MSKMFRTIVLVALLVACVSAARRAKEEPKPEQKPELASTEQPELKAEELEAATEKQEPTKNKPDLSAHKPDKIAVIKSKTITSDLDGNYQVQFESSNGIASNEGGVAGQIVQGSTTWIAKNGEPLAISFVADENGYRPMGFHLPTPPPIPLAIQRALDYLATKKPDVDDN